MSGGKMQGETGGKRKGIQALDEKLVDKMGRILVKDG